MNSTLPFVSVLLPVYNGEPYLGKAIQSILNQTYTNFEFIIINDGSTDTGLQTIKSFDDNRIKVIDQENKGLITTLNIGLQLAKGKYILRMDQDDEALPERFDQQIKFMENNLNVGLCGTSFYYVKGDVETKSVWHLNSEELKISLLYTCPILHPTAIIRTDVLRKNNLQYTLDVTSAEELDLWYRISLVSDLAILPSVLLKYRLHENSISKKRVEEQTQSALKTHRKVLRNLCRENDAHFNSINNELHLLLYKKPIDFSDLKQILKLLRKLIEINKSTRVYDNNEFKKITALHSYLLNYRFGFSFSFKLLMLYITEGGMLFWNLPADKKMKFVAKCLLKKNPG